MTDSKKVIEIHLAAPDPRIPEGAQKWNDNESYKFNKKTLRDEVEQETKEGEAGKVRNLGYDLSIIQDKDALIQGGTSITEESKAKAKAIPLPFVVRSVQRSAEERSLGLELTVYIPFVIAFCFFFLAGRSIEDGYYVGKGVFDTVTGNFPIEEGIGPYWEKTFSDVRTPADWYIFMEGVMAPSFWTDPASVQVSGYNIKLGSLRIRAWSVQNNTCTVNDNWYPKNESVFPRFCYDRYTESKAWTADSFGPPQDPTRFKFLDCPEFVGRQVLGRVATYPCGGHVLDIPFNLSASDALDMVKSLRGISTVPGQPDVGFIDSVQTRFVSVEFFLYSPVYNVFTASKWWVEVTKGGAWLPGKKTNTFEVWSMKHLPYTIYQFFFLAFVLYYVVKFFRELVQAHRERRRGALKYMCDMWNFLEICNLITFLIVFGIRFAWWYKSRQMNFVLPGTGYVDQLDYINWLYLAQVYTNALNTIITFLKVLKFVKLNDRLNILTRTMEACQQNIIGILAVFFLLVLAYSITSTSLFGNSLERYRNLENSFSANFLMLLGDFNYAELYEEDRFVTAVFFWSYFILALFLLLNFILAVIADSFGKENEKTRAEPLFETVRGFFQRLLARFRSFMHAPGERIKEMFRRKSEGQKAVSSSEKLIDNLRRYHASQLTFTPEELLVMDEDEILDHPPHEDIMRRDIERIFKEADPTDGEKDYKVIGEAFFDALWLGVFKDYKLRNSDEDDEEEEHEKELYETACSAIRTVLGLEKKEEHEELSEGTNLVRQLFTPAEETLSLVDRLSTRLSELETTMSTITTTAIRLDYALTSLYTDIKASQAKTVSDSTPAPAQPTSLPPLPPIN